jgi:hypothetical protein
MFFVEGDDDQRFLERIISPLLADKYPIIKYFRYAPCVPKEVCNLVRSIETSWDYFFLADLDQNECLIRKREAVCERMRAVNLRQVVIVEREIESWYASGVDANTAKKIGFKLPRDSGSFSKEHLLRCVGKKFSTATDIRLALLDSYSLQRARLRSTSLSYLCERLQID